jgi:AcrR family transcriptional regulator
MAKGDAETAGDRGRVGQPELRRDAAANRERLLVAAAAAVRREGVHVPLATVAADAGVGVGTLYRHYPSREALLMALTHRSFRMVLDSARRAAAIDEAAIEALRLFYLLTIEHSADLVLPLHGGPVLRDEETITLRNEVHETIQQILVRGRRDGTIRSDVTATDIIIFGALLVEPLAHVPDWKLTAQRQAAVFLNGLAVMTGHPLPKEGTHSGAIRDPPE